MAISKIILNGVTQIDLTQDTVANAAHIMNGYVGHLVDGTQVTGTGQGSGTLISKTITLNGTYDPDDDNADGYSGVTVNVQNGASMAEVSNTYGTEIIVSSAQGATPSVTRHTLYFEYEDGTTETEYVYYDDTLVGTAITATTPTTRSNKTVTSAQLDGVEWYSYTPPTPEPEPEPEPVTENFETLFDDNIDIQSNGGDAANTGYMWIPSLANVNISDGSRWRITIDGVSYVKTASYESRLNQIAILYGESGNENIAFYNGDGAWVGYVVNRTTGNVALKIERAVTS